MSRFSGAVQVDGRPEGGAEVLLLSAAGKVVAIRNVDATGHYGIEIPQGYAGGFLLFRLYKPLVGVRAVPVLATGQQIDLSVSSADAVSLGGELKLPADAQGGWVDVELTPRDCGGLPPQAKDAILASDLNNGIRGSFLTERITDQRFRFRVLPGLYDLRAGRFIDAPPMAKGVPLNLEPATLTLPDGKQPNKKFGGYLLELQKDTDVTLTLRAAGQG